MLKFLGRGSAFNTKEGNNSAYIKENNTLFLIDCGSSVFQRIVDKNLLQNVENVHVAITHLHPDHVGSLGDLIFYCFYVLRLKLKIYHPNKQKLQYLLRLMGIKTDMYDFYDFTVYKIKELQLNFCFQTTIHCDELDAYNIKLTCDDGIEAFYSGDSNDISVSELDILSIKTKDASMSKSKYYFYQDCCGMDYEGNVHLSYKKLCNMIPQDCRANVYIMHIDKNFNIKQAKSDGFNVVEVE